MVKRGTQIGGAAFLLGYLLGRRKLDRLTQLAALAASRGRTAQPRKLAKRSVRKLTRGVGLQPRATRRMRRNLRRVSRRVAPKPAAQTVTRRLRELLPTG